MRPAPLLASFATLWAVAAWADTVDRPTLQRRTLRGSARVTGAFSFELGFPAYTYRAVRDGFARIHLATANLAERPRDNAGRAWRPFLRVIGEASETRRGEGWSTNGQPGDPDTGRASLVVRVRAGETFTIVATLGENMRGDVPAAAATYTLVVTELPR